MSCRVVACDTCHTFSLQYLLHHHIATLTHTVVSLPHKALSVMVDFRDDSVSTWLQCHLLPKCLDDGRPRHERQHVLI